MSEFSRPGFSGWRPAVCKTGLAASRRKMIVHRVDTLKTAVIDGRLCYSARWACGGCSPDAVIIADPAPLGGICERCEMAGWFVYHCRDAAARLLWIGSTGNRYARFRDHAKRTPWWPEVADIRLTEFPDEAGARYAEALAIHAERPLHNKQPGAKRLKAAA